ncbi:YgjV family protein [Roseovarius indicus]|uniref:Bacterial inner membrane protein n=1 Tax=Roseovarius indicus TaxID=540747 RepID=A0A0T5PDM9_9RHOB|nr:YgjV family protein [Roseovarius indicus]KRS19203.1 hypothetical protein XM52_05985 [Roseovarius indicus]QEW25832.1 Bacterial inner membrane protein [Roseovarius indicus]SFD89024.1 inner membrane protein [Roseovarius indicus]
MIAQIFPDDPATLLTGLAAILCLSSSPAFGNRKAMLTAQLAASAFFLAHYLCLGITVAAAANALGFVQTLAAILAPCSARMNRLGYGLIGLMLLGGFWFWQGPISGLSMLAMTAIALGRMQTDQLRLRLLLLAGGAAWIAHDFIGEAWLALVADIGAFMIGLVALVAMHVCIRIEWRLPAPMSANPAA